MPAYYDMPANSVVKPSEVLHDLQISQCRSEKWPHQGTPSRRCTSPSNTASTAPAASLRAMGKMLCETNETIQYRGWAVKTPAS